MFKQHDPALAIVGLAIDFEIGSDAALFWHDVEQGALSRASQAANLPPERVRALVETALVDANLGGIELPVFLVGRPGMLSDAGLQGCECATVAACLNRALRMTADQAVIGVCGRGGVMFAVHKLSENNKNVAGAYAFLGESHDVSDLPVVSHNSPQHLAAAILSLCFHIKPPGLFAGADSATFWPWIHRAHELRSLVISRAGDSQIVATEPATRRFDQPRRKAPAASVLFLSAADAAGLSARIAAAIDGIDRNSDANAEEIARVMGRDPPGPERAGIVASSVVDLRKKLVSARDAVSNPKGISRIGAGVFLGGGQARGKLAFLFPGQGSEYPGMLRELASMSSSVRLWFNSLERAYARERQPLPSYVFDGTDHNPERLLDLRTGAQLGLTASLAFYELLTDIGVQADCMLGHSKGEYGAIFAAGMVALSDRDVFCDQLCAVSMAAGRLTPPAEPEAMMAVSPVREAVIRPLLQRQQGRIFLAIDNCPTQQILGGTTAALEHAHEVLRKSGCICSFLPFDRAHHTPLFSDWADLLRKEHAGLTITAARVPVYSAATASILPRDSGEIQEMMAAHWRMPVRFRETIERLYADGVRYFLETGPDSKLSGFVRDILRQRPHVAVSASSRISPDIQTLSQLFAQLYTGGIPFSMNALDRFLLGEPIRRQPLREMPDIRTIVLDEYHATMRMAAAASARVQSRFSTAMKHRSAPVHGWPLSGELVSQHADAATYSRMFQLGRDRFLADHSMGASSIPGRATPVLAMTFTAAVAAEAAMRFGGGTVISMSGVRAQRWLALDDDLLKLRIVVSRAHDGMLNVQIYDANGDNERPSFQARVAVGGVKPQLKPVMEAAGRTPPRGWTPERFYGEYAFHGPSWRGIRGVRAVSGGRIEANLEVLPAVGAMATEWAIDPALLDCAGQLAAFWLLENESAQPGLFPFSIGELRIAGQPPEPGTRLLCRGTIEKTRFGTTSSDFDFVLPDGRVLWQLIGLEQKIVNFPRGLASRIFGRNVNEPIGEELLLPKGYFGSWIGSETAEFLDVQQTLWPRVLARSMMNDEEFSRFRSVRTADATRCLVERLAITEAARRRASANGSHYARAPVLDDGARGIASLAGLSFAIAIAADPSCGDFRLHTNNSESQGENSAGRVIWEAELEGQRFSISAL